MAVGSLLCHCAPLSEALRNYENSTLGIKPIHFCVRFIPVFKNFVNEVLPLDTVVLGPTVYSQPLPFCSYTEKSCGCGLSSGQGLLPTWSCVFVFQETLFKITIPMSNTAACFQDCWGGGACPHFTVPVPKDLIF